MPLVIIIGVPAAAVKLPEHEVHLAYAGLMWMPFIVAAAIGAWLYMDSLTQAKADTASYVQGARARPDVDHVDPLHRHVRLVHRLLVRAAAGDQEHVPGVPRRAPFIATYLAGLGFVGALIGSVARPLGGWLSDRVGGAG